MKLWTCINPVASRQEDEKFNIILRYIPSFKTALSQKRKQNKANSGNNVEENPTKSRNSIRKTGGKALKPFSKTETGTAQGMEQ